MTDANAIFADMSVGVFDALGQDETVQRGTDTPVPVRVVIEYGIERVGDWGQVVGRVTTASCLVSQVRARLGDVLTVSGVSKKVAGVDPDDGFVAKAVLHG